MREDELDDLKDALQSFFSSLAAAIPKAKSPADLKDLIERFGRRIRAMKEFGADVSCINFMLGRLADFGDEWAKIEEEAQPRLPMNMINSLEAELKEIQREKATKASQSQECKEKADQHKSRSARRTRFSLRAASEGRSSFSNRAFIVNNVTSNNEKIRSWMHAPHPSS